MAWEEDIWNELRNMRKQMDEVFGGFEQPERIDLSDEIFKEENFRKADSNFKEEEDKYIINIELPGIKKEDIKVNVTRRGLEIKAGTKKEESGEGENEYKSFKSFSGFYQAIDLPENADAENIDASYENGVLTLSVPKKEKEKSDSKEIQVK